MSYEVWGMVITKGYSIEFNLIEIQSHNRTKLQTHYNKNVENVENIKCMQH